MRCHICNSVIDEPIWDRDHADWAPCGTCEYEIRQLLASYQDCPFDPDVAPEGAALYYSTEEAPNGD